MKTDSTIQTPFLFTPEISLQWPTIPRSKPRRRALGLAMETQIDYKQEFVCGIILTLCVLFGLAVVMAQFALA